MVGVESRASQNPSARKKPQLGDYVTGYPEGLKGIRQGVLIEIRPNGTSVVKGQLDTYICEGSLTEVPDRNLLLGTREFVDRVRVELAEVRTDDQGVIAEEGVLFLDRERDEAILGLMRLMDIDDSSEDDDSDL